MRPRVGLALLFIALSSTSPAFGQAPSFSPPVGPDAPATAPDPKARALAKYDEGSQAFAEGRYKDAIDLFLAGDAIVPNASFAFNIGLAYERMKDDAHALGWTREYLRRKPDAHDRGEALARISRLEQALQAKGVQQITVLSTPEGATVLIDGKPTGVTPWTGELTPGKHEVRARLKGYSDGVNDMALTPERAMDISFVLAKERAVAPAPRIEPSQLPEGEGGDTGSGGIGWYTWTALGIGAASFAATAALEVARSAAVEDALGADTQLDAEASLDTAGDFQIGARVMVSVAAVSTALGVVLLVIDLNDGDGEADVARCRSGVCDVVVRF